jgi:hypothetical protein
MPSIFQTLIIPMIADHQEEGRGPSTPKPASQAKRFSPLRMTELIQQSYLVARTLARSSAAISRAAFRAASSSVTPNEIAPTRA